MKKRTHSASRSPFWKRAAYWSLVAIGGFYLSIAVLLLALRWIDPPFTAVQAERRLTALFHHETYRKHYEFVPLRRISPNMQHAAIAAEDARFYQHHGFDWGAIEQAAQQDLNEGRKRGASTIDQQLVRNLFLSTGRSFIRKALEASIVPLAESLLGKRRILELYLNVIEFGPGIYGCQAAAEIYFSQSAANLSVSQAIQLAEVLPSPLHTKPGQRPEYGKRIALRMRQAGW